MIVPSAVPLLSSDVARFVYSVLALDTKMLDITQKKILG
jgi:hypothetical protein